MNTGSMHNGLYLSERPRIYLRDDPGHPGLKAKASLTLNGAVAIKNIRILVLGGKTIVAFPSRQRPDGRYMDVTHPIDNDVRAWLEGALLEAYHRELAYGADWDAATDPARRDDPAEEVLLAQEVA